jgi:hypothetical protein
MKMRHVSAVRVLCVGLFWVISSFSEPVSASQLEVKYSTCQKLIKSLVDGYKIDGANGVARSYSAVGNTGALVDSNLYFENQHLDSDKDGVACERFVYDSGITKTSRGAADAYSACRAHRMGEQRTVNLSVSDYPYTNGLDQLRAYYFSYLQAVSLIEKAAKANPMFKSAAVNAQTHLAFQSKVMAVWPKQTSAKVPAEYIFDEWCVYFGVYDSRPGLYPPITLNIPTRSSTPLDGARGFCKRLFSESPDGRMYSGSEVTTLYECDDRARYVARQAATYNAAKDKMINEYFLFIEYWCWGTNCLTEFDF